MSGGRWRAWQQSALPYVQGRRILELGCGPGHLLLDLEARGYRVFGVDRSPTMWTTAQRRLGRSGRFDRVIAADARALPFDSAAFDSIVMTFPSPVIREPSLWQEAARVLRPGGRFVVVVGARSNSRLWPACLERLVALAEGGTRSGRVSSTETTESKAALEAELGIAEGLFTGRRVVETTGDGVVDLLIAERLGSRA